MFPCTGAGSRYLVLLKPEKSLLMVWLYEDEFYANRCILLTFANTPDKSSQCYGILKVLSSLYAK